LFSPFSFQTIFFGQFLQIFIDEILGPFSSLSFRASLISFIPFAASITHILLYSVVTQTGVYCVYYYALWVKMISALLFVGLAWCIYGGLSLAGMWPFWVFYLVIQIVATNASLGFFSITVGDLVDQHQELIAKQVCVVVFSCSLFGSRQC
jgi:hypothetical protein